MKREWRHLPLVAAFALLFVPSVALAYGAIYGGPACGANGTVTVEWTFYEDAPFGHPEWVGYDIVRKAVNQCTEFERLNAEIIPRGTGVHSRTFTDTSPSTATLYEYQIVPVNSSRNQLSYSDFYISDVFMSCPDRSAPVALGTVEDIGWAVTINNCPEFCWYGAYINDPPADIRGYAGTGVVLRFFGRMGCGSVEGCSLEVDRYEVAACVPVPTQSTTWGQIKARYH
jgi:hypothetical protein